MRAELQRLKRDTDSSRQSPVASSGVAPLASSLSQSAQTAGSSAVVTAAKQHKIGIGIVSVIAILLIAAAYGVYTLLSRGRPIPFQNYEVSTATNNGKARLVDISPDGKYLVYVTDDSGQQSLWLENIPTRSNTQIVGPAPVLYLGVRFSPDSNHVYYVRSEPASPTFRYLYRAPVLGGTPQKLVDDIDSNISFSPDGKKFAYVLGNSPKPGEYQLMVRFTESGSAKPIAGGSINEVLWDVAWSPDGQTIVMPLVRPGDAYGGLVAIDVENGKRKPFLISKNLFFERPVWLADGSGLLALASTYSGRNQIVHIEYPTGKVSPVTRDTSDYIDLNVAANVRTIAAVVENVHDNLYVMDEGFSSSRARELPMQDFPSYQLGWTPDGQLLMNVYGEKVTRLNPKTGVQTSLSLQARFPSYAQACSDGRIVFSAQAEIQQNHVFRADADGGNVKELTHGKYDYMPVCSADSKTVLYVDADLHLEKVGIDGGPIRRFADNSFPRVTVSPDGKLAAIVTARPGQTKEQIGVLTSDSTMPIRLLDFERPRAGLYVQSGRGPILFKRDSTGIIYPIHNDQSDNLWLQHLDGSTGKQLTDFKSEFIRDFDYSYDGKRLAVIRGHRDTDVILIHDLEK